MKKTILFLAIAAALASCSNTKTVPATVSQYGETAASVITTLSPDSKLADIARLFVLLDTNKDKAISITEATGIVADNFGVLDIDKSSGIDLDELGAILGLLK
jgi:hypothetical protein